MTDSYFSGSYHAKVDEKNRFVLPQELRYQLVDDGRLEFVIALGMNGCLTIYKTGDMARIVEEFRKRQHVAKFQKFFTLFFSTLFHTTCDKIGRVMIPAVLKEAAQIESEITLAGALSKIEIWPKKTYAAQLESYLGSNEGTSEMQELMQEAFSLLSEETNGVVPEAAGEWKKIQI